MIPLAYSAEVAAARLAELMPVWAEAPAEPPLFVERLTAGC